MKRKKVHIVGFAGGFELIPWDDRSWEIWGFNQFYRSIRPTDTHPFDRWFELHLPSYFRWDSHGNPDEGWKDIADELNGLLEPWTLPDVLKMIDADKEFTAAEKKRARRRVIQKYEKMVPTRAVPIVYLPEADPLVPKATAYPREKVERAFPRGAYHAGSFDWMLALAMLEGFTDVRITGVNFANGGEPISARPCLEYWIGLAQGRGISVEVLGNTDLFRIFHLARSDTQYGFAPWALVEEHTYAETRGERADISQAIAAGRVD